MQLQAYLKLCWQCTSAVIGLTSSLQRHRHTAIAYATAEPASWWQTRGGARRSTQGPGLRAPAARMLGEQNGSVKRGDTGNGDTSQRWRRPLHGARRGRQGDPPATGCRCVLAGRAECRMPLPQPRCCLPRSFATPLTSQPTRTRLSGSVAMTGPYLLRPQRHRAHVVYRKIDCMVHAC